MNLYLSQFCLEMPAGTKKEYLYFPYSAGCVWAYANENPDVRNNFELKEIFIRKEDPKTIVDALDDPKVFGFSTYVWNYNYNKMLAKMVKKKFPGCIIVFGGPNVPVESEQFLLDNPYIDYAIYHEGEITFTNVLLRILGKEHKTNGIGFLNKGKINTQSKPERIADLDSAPSPYTMGYFDHLIEKYKNTDITLNAILETNRGCPFGCTFCDWGNGMLGKVKKFNICRVHGDILWMAKNKVEYVSNADANFGAFKERDLEIAKFIVETKKKYDWPKIFHTNWHKNQSEHLVDIAKVLLDGGVLRGFTASLQTTTQSALDAIKRKNIGINLFEKIKEICENNNIGISTELLVPLPGETYDSFKKCLEYLYEIDISVNAGPITVLVNSEMNQPAYREKYGLVTQTNHFGNCPYVLEQEEPIIQTRTMSKLEFQKVMLITWAMGQFHVYGFTDLIAKYYKKTEGIDFTDFYEKMIDFFRNRDNSVISKHITPFLNHVDDKKTNLLCGGIESVSMFNDIGTQNRELFYAEIKEFCKKCLPDNDNINDLIALQYNWQNHQKNNNDQEIRCKSNLFDYIMHDEKFVTKDMTYVSKGSGIPKRFASFGHYILYYRYTKNWNAEIEILN